MIVDDVVAAAFKVAAAWGHSGEFAAEMAGATIVKVPFSLSPGNEYKKLDELLPPAADHPGSFLAPWVRPPYDRLILVSDLSPRHCVYIRPYLEVLGPAPVPMYQRMDEGAPVAVGKKAVWAVEAVCITPLGDSPAFVVEGLARIAGMDDGYVSLVLWADDKEHLAAIDMRGDVLAITYDLSGPEVMRYYGEWIEESFGPQPDARGWSWRLPSICATAFGLLNCKNVSTVDVAPPRQLRRAAEREGRRLFTVKTLVVCPQKASASTGVGGNGQPLSLHWVRGHFKHYSAEKPLFGRITGAFWWSPHLAGSVEAGVVVKDYEIKGEA